MTIGGSHVSSIAICRFLPLSTWMRSVTVRALSTKIVCARLNTASRSLTGVAAHFRCAARDLAKACSMSSGVDCGSSTSSCPV